MLGFFLHAIVDSQSCRQMVQNRNLQGQRQLLTESSEEAQALIQISLGATSAYGALYRSECGQVQRKYRESRENFFALYGM